jgi:hypothetical protein
MSNQKFKIENYQNVGGINSKFSPHLLTPIEFMDIKNYDFQTPGSLTQRWGSTQYMGQTLAGKITALSEYQKLSGVSMIITGSSGGLWYGATTGNFQGMSLTQMGSTIVLSMATIAIGMFRSLGWGTGGAGITIGESNQQGIFYQGSSNQLMMNYATADYPYYGYNYTIPPQLQGGNFASIEYLVDRAFIADGTKFVKFDGVTTTNVGLPIPIPASMIYQYDLSNSASLMGFGATGAAIFYVSYVNDRGFESQIVPVASALGPMSGPSVMPADPSGTMSMTMIMNTPLAYGISSINVYSYCVQAPYKAGFAIQFWYSDSQMWNYPFVKINSIPASGSTQTGVPLGTTNLNFPQIFNNVGPLSNPYTNQYQPLGLTLGTANRMLYHDNGTTNIFTAIQGYSKPYQVGYYPQFLAVYDNRMFCAGFSATPSTVWFSDVKEPEGYLPTNNFEVRTNDSDYITSMKSYQTRLYIFKRNSFHVLVGDSPANFFIQEISNLYGCMNNRCTLLFDDILVFLDRKGVFQYNGANLQYISPKIQPIFDRMNYTAALACACGAHDKLRNQVLFAIPIDGSTTNNITIVYDYVANAWSTHTGYNASIFAELQGNNTIRRLFHGDYNGRVNWFSASFLSDNGSAMTLSFKTRFLHDMGDSVQKQFRRLYVNADNLGSTLASKINFYQDYGTSIVLGTTLNLGAFQERIDYGISSKSLAFEMITVNTTSSPLSIHGFTIESRLQRKV